MDRYTVAPVQFTEKEANALITAQHLVSRSNDSSFVADFEEALTKIKSVFRSSILEKSEVLNSQLHIFDTHKENICSNGLSELQLAITNFNYTVINYRKADDPNISFRKIELCAIISTENKWILMAWCHLRKDYRAFRIDRIQHFKILPVQFEDRKFNMRDYYRANPYDHKNGARIT
jgi:predicted DNA-binding transcriptional regulator YafY